MASKPDLNALDYYVLGRLEQETKPTHKTVDSLKQTIATAAANMSTDEVVCTCSRFQKQIELVLEAEGGWIE